MGKEKEIIELHVTKSMCAKVFPVIKPGDHIIVNSKVKPLKGDFVLVLDNERNWIDKYSRELYKFNVHSIIRVVMNS